MGNVGYYLSTVLEDYSRYIIAWKLFSTMSTGDVKETLDAALAGAGVERVQITGPASCRVS